MLEQQVIGWIILLFFLILIMFQIKGINQIQVFQYFTKFNWIIFGVAIFTMAIILIQEANILIHYFILLVAIISLLLLPRLGGLNFEKVIHRQGGRMVPTYTPLSDIKWIEIHPMIQKYKVAFILEKRTIYMEFSEDDYDSLTEIVKYNKIEIR